MTTDPSPDRKVDPPRDDRLTVSAVPATALPPSGPSASPSPVERAILEASPNAIVAAGFTGTSSGYLFGRPEAFSA
jgi:hypothetical protein